MTANTFRRRGAALLAAGAIFSLAAYILVVTALGVALDLHTRSMSAMRRLPILIGAGTVIFYGLMPLLGVL